MKKLLLALLSISSVSVFAFNLTINNSSSADVTLKYTNNGTPTTTNLAKSQSVTEQLSTHDGFFIYPNQAKFPIPEAYSMEVDKYLLALFGTGDQSLKYDISAVYSNGEIAGFGYAGNNSNKYSPDKTMCTPDLDFVVCKSPDMQPTDLQNLTINISDPTNTN